MKHLITYITGKWPLLTVYELMLFQMTLVTEGFITHLTGKWLLPSVNDLMSFQIALMTE
jgi:hypothetical protein